MSAPRANGTAVSARQPSLLDARRESRLERVCASLAVLVVVALAGSPAFADPAPVTAAAPALKNASLGLVLLKLGVGMAVVLGLIVLLQRLARRYGRAFTGGNGSDIKIAAQRTLGPKLSLALVEVRGRTLLLGVGGNGVNMLSDLSVAPAPSNTLSDGTVEGAQVEDEFARELRRRIAELERTQTLEDLLAEPEARR